MNISEILDTIDDMLDKSWGLPLSGGKCVVDVERLRDLIGDVRLNMPVEIKQAKMIVADRKQIVDDAKREAEIIIKAEERAKAIVDHDELVKKAQVRANEINTQAQVQSVNLSAPPMSLLIRACRKSRCSPKFAGKLNQPVLRCVSQNSSNGAGKTAKIPGGFIPPGIFVLFRNSFISQKKIAVIWKKN